MLNACCKQKKCYDVITILNLYPTHFWVYPTLHSTTFSRDCATPSLSISRAWNNCYLRRGSNNEISTSNRVSPDLYIFLLTCCYALYLVGEYGTRYHVRPHWPPTESSPHGNTGAEEYFLYQQYCFVGVAAWRTVGELMTMQPSKWLIVF